MLKANHDHRSPTMDIARPQGAAREPSVGPPVLPVPAAPHPSAPPARGGIIRAAALTALTLFTVICSLQSGLIHQSLIAEHMEMNAVEGWAFVAMTAGCYASSVSVAAAGFWLWRRSHRAASLITLTALGAFMASMIGLYFYVHAPSLQSTWLPLGIEHEPFEEAGTAAVWNEATAILAIVLVMAISAIRPHPTGDSKENPDPADGTAG